MGIYAEIDEDDSTKIKIAEFEWKYKELLKSLPSSKYKNDAWYFNLTWQMCLALKSTFRDNLTVGEKLKEWSTKEYNDIILPAYRLRNVVEAEGYPELYPHQRGDVQFLATSGRAILANGLGSGKSRSVFSTVKYMYSQDKDVFPVLISCPNSTKYSWEKEINEVWPGLKVSVVDGTATQRRKAFAEQAHVYIINWESVRTHSNLAAYGSTALKKCEKCGGLDDKVTANACEKHKKELNDIEFKTVIGDEIHRIKDPSTKMSRAFKSATGDAKFRFGLSGTPIASAPDDLFSVLNWLMPEAYPSKTKYIDRFCLTTFNSWGGIIVLGIRPEMEQEFFAGLDPFLRRMPNEIILPFLPPVTRIRRDVEMGTKQKKAYKQMQDNMLAELDEGEVVFTTSPLTKMTRLLQFSSAFAEIEYRDILNQETGEIENKPFVKLSDPSCTLDSFMDDIDDFGDESVIVFAVSSQLINMLSDRLTKAKIPHGLITGDQDAKERQIHMNNFQEGKTKFILCTISAGGTGITLTRGNNMVFLQRSWSNIENTQAEGRGRRIGSEIHDNIKIIDYVTTGSVQETVFKAMEEKGNQLEYILRDKETIRKAILNQEIEDKQEEAE